MGFETKADTPRVIGVAYDGSDESQAALHEATEIALELNATLRLVTAIAPLEHFWSAEAFTAGVASGDEIRAQRHEAFRQQLAKATEARPPEVRAAPVKPRAAGGGDRGRGREGDPRPLCGVPQLWPDPEGHGRQHRDRDDARRAMPVVVMPRGATRIEHAGAETPETTRVI